MNQKQACEALAHIMIKHKITLEPDIYGGICLLINNESELHFKDAKCLLEHAASP